MIRWIAVHRCWVLARLVLFVVIGYRNGLLNLLRLLLRCTVACCLRSWSGVTRLLVLVLRRACLMIWRFLSARVLLRRSPIVIVVCRAITFLIRWRCCVYLYRLLSSRLFLVRCVCLRVYGVVRLLRSCLVTTRLVLRNLIVRHLKRLIWVLRLVLIIILVRKLRRIRRFRALLMLRMSWLGMLITRIMRRLWRLRILVLVVVLVTMMVLVLYVMLLRIIRPSLRSRLLRRSWRVLLLRIRLLKRLRRPLLRVRLRILLLILCVVSMLRVGRVCMKRLVIRRKKVLILRVLSKCMLLLVLTLIFVVGSVRCLIRAVVSALVSAQLKLLRRLSVFCTRCLSRLLRVNLVRMLLRPVRSLMRVLLRVLELRRWVVLLRRLAMRIRILVMVVFLLRICWKFTSDRPRMRRLATCCRLWLLKRRILVGRLLTWPNNLGLCPVSCRFIVLACGAWYRLMKRRCVMVVIGGRYDYWHVEYLYLWDRV